MLAAVGTRGDVQPMIALAQAIRSRGHSALVAAPPDFEGWVRSHGLEFVPIGQSVHRFLAETPDVLTGNALKAARGWEAWFREGLPLQVRQGKVAGEGVDAIAWGGLALALPSVAEHLKIPALGVIYSTSLVPSRMHPPPTIPRQTLPQWLNQLLWLMHRFFAQRMVGPLLTPARAELGLGAVHLHTHLFEQGRYVIATDEGLFPNDPAWGGNFHRANYIYYDDPLPLDPDLASWLDDGEPPVFIDFGSMSGPGMQRVAQVVMPGLAALKRRCLVGARLAEHAGPGLPVGWRAVGVAPHAKLFPRLAAVVHHGGSGTTANALRAGVPQVIVPLILDQYQHAHRLHLAGLAPRPVPMERITAAQLAEAIDTAIALPPAAREEVARRLSACDASGDIARYLEAMVMDSRDSGSAAAAAPMRPFQGSGAAAALPAG